MTNGMSRALTTVRSVAKRSTKVVADVLPIATVGANVLNIIMTTDPKRPDLMLIKGVQRYSGYNILSGAFDWAEFGKGTGSLIVAGIAGKAMKWLS